MSAAANYLALDLGASSGRAVLGRFDGRKLSLSEIHRFPNGPTRLLGHWRWDILQLFEQIKLGLAKCATEERNLKGLGIDTWGVDFGLLSAKGELLSLPYHYRDPRTKGMLEEAFRIVPRDQIYRETGIQFMELNTLYQLLALKRDHPDLLAAAHQLLFIPDLLHYWLTGVPQSEYSIASTSQLYNMTSRGWAKDLIARFGLPTGIMPPVCRPGQPLGALLADVAEETGLAPTQVIAPACHDTGSAVAAVPAQGNDWAYISSGTWSLVGVEIPEPICTNEALAMNFTNEGGVADTIRLLKNIAGLWLVQECRRTWEIAGQALSYEQLAAMAAAAPPAVSFVDPDETRFTEPGDMPRRIQQYCREKGQHVPHSKGAIVRCALESLALKYRLVITQIESLIGRSIRKIHIVGGGVNNTLLCQLTASVTKKPVIAGPAEATAAGNILVQALGLGELSSLAELREVMAQSTRLEHYEPQDSSRWDEAFARFETIIRQGESK